MRVVTDRKIGVLMGGSSPEREISLKSGNAVLTVLMNNGYNVVAVDVGNDICGVLKREGIEIAFLALHGGYGENGGIQGLLEVLSIPYTGSGILASALAMDKEATKKMFLNHGIQSPPFIVLKDVEAGKGKKGKGVTLDAGISMHGLNQTEFGFPVVVKPAAEGSSIGVSIVREESAMDAATERALEFGDRVIVEKYIDGKEVQIGILNDKVLGSVEVRPKLDFYSYEAKYTAGLTEYILPPDIRPDILRRAEEAALAAHRSLFCSGATRVDLIIDDSGNPFVLEVNTIPGMTETSLLPKIALIAGLDFASLIEALLRDSLKTEDRS
jgi:D-alanine-D-alanine ligase